METKKVTLNEVKMQFLLADKFREYFEKVPEESIIDDICRLTEEYDKMLRSYEKLSEIEINKLFIDKTRLTRYDSLDWNKGEIELARMGPWPEMKGLDIRYTTGNVPDTVERVKKVWKDRTIYNQPKIPRGFYDKINSIKSNFYFVYPRFPIILTPGGTERAFHNEWVRNGGEGLIKQGQENDWLCQIYDYDVDSGNARAFSYASLNIDRINCYFGRRKIE
ncbi:MAG: hypothetical protein WC867_06790 [Candidatus Pacearchaeota archaeon]|jgi:hypothetical protein